MKITKPRASPVCVRPRSPVERERADVVVIRSVVMLVVVVMVVRALVVVVVVMGPWCVKVAGKWQLKTCGDGKW